MTHHTRMIKTALLGAAAMALTACGGGGSSPAGLGGPVTVTPPTPPVSTPAPAPVAEKGCAGRETENSVDQAISSGVLGDVTLEALFNMFQGS